MKRFLALLTLGLSIFFCSSVEAQLNAKKIIEFGWDYPDVNQLKVSLPSIEKLPFNGVAFSLQRKITDIFDTIPLKDDYFQFETLKALPWKNFTDNFICIWATSTTGGHWFDDHAWQTIVENTKKVSKAVQAGQCKGILLDPEYYYPEPNANPWIYKRELYGNRSYEQVAATVKKRGSQFIKALESSKPDVKVLATWLFGLISDQLRSKALPDIGQALYLPFIDGMLAGKSGNSVIIDGNENAYWYTKAADFMQSKQIIKSKAKTLLPKTGNTETVQVAQCLYYDGIFDLLPAVKRNSSNEYNENLFADNLYNALAGSDEYVWIYAEKLNWYQLPATAKMLKLVEGVSRKYRESPQQ